MALGFSVAAAAGACSVRTARPRAANCPVRWCRVLMALISASNAFVQNVLAETRIESLPHSAFRAP